jgi:hypothetical protein
MLVASNPSGLVPHLGAMDTKTFRLRAPADPAPPPIKEPPDSPEDPHVPVREPEPEEPNQI